MTYARLFKRLLKMTPQELRQKVKLEEGCSGNVTEITCIEKAKKTMFHEELVENEGGKADKDGLTQHWESTGEVKFRKGQVWLIHDH